MSANKNIPEELVEKILWNLPIKSLFRFSTVSKSWNLMISRPEFMKRYRGRELVVLRPYSDDDADDKALAIPPSSILSGNPNPLAKVTPFLCPFTYVRASCGELWCVEFQSSLLLYNPSIQRYRKLPTPSATLPVGSTVDGAHNTVFVYGLGYDSAADDYKIVKIHMHSFVMAELYSLRSDCWRKINSPPSKPYQFTFYSKKGVFVYGAVHWLVTIQYRHAGIIVRCYGPHILYFHLSLEKYRTLKLPKLPFYENLSKCSDLFAFGGKLRLYINYECHTRFSVWVMEDFESNLWTKEIEINYANVYPLCFANLKPFYFYDGDGNVIKAVTSPTDTRKIFIYKEEENDGPSTLVEKNFGNIGCGMFDTYVESFISVWPGVTYEVAAHFDTYVESFISNDAPQRVDCLRSTDTYIESNSITV